jgi:hypothetical protein
LRIQKRGDALYGALDEAVVSTLVNLGKSDELSGFIFTGIYFYLFLLREEKRSRRGYKISFLLGGVLFT